MFHRPVIAVENDAMEALPAPLRRADRSSIHAFPGDAFGLHPQLFSSLRHNCSLFIAAVINAFSETLP
jgi:hypothetical protein